MIGVAVDVFSKGAEYLSPLNMHSVPVICDLYILAKVTTIKASSLMILSMSIERFYATFYPFPYKDNVTMRTMAKTGMFCTVIAAVSSCLVLAVQGNTTGRKCFATRQNVSEVVTFLVVIESALLFFIIPSVLTTVLNVLIVAKLRSQSSVQRLVPCSETLTLKVKVCHS